MKYLIKALLLFILSGFPFSISIAQNWDSYKVTPQKLSEHIYMLTGVGGNIGLTVGEDGIFIIDDQFAQLNEKIKAAINSIQPGNVSMVINTHWHGDHTGGNKIFGEDGAIIIAQDNVRKRLKAGQISFFGDTIAPAPNKALPILTFEQEVKLYLNGDSLDVFHVKNAHTDGDAVIRFTRSNIVHMGDNFFNGFYPVIDIASGGSINGMINAVNYVIDNKVVDGNTKIIPGHGPLGNLNELKEFVKMLAGIRDNVLTLVNEGKSLNEVLEAKPGSKYDEKWGKGFIKPDSFIKTVYTDLSRK